MNGKRFNSEARRENTVDRCIGNYYTSDGILIMAMEYQMLESHLLSKKGSFKDFPFGPNAAVFKVARKMFALVAVNEKSLRITLTLVRIQRMPLG